MGIDICTHVFAAADVWEPLLENVSPSAPLAVPSTSLTKNVIADVVYMSNVSAVAPV